MSCVDKLDATVHSVLTVDAYARIHTAGSLCMDWLHLRV